MFRRFGFLATWRWLLLYVAVIGAVAGMILLGRWQLHRAHEHHGSIQNYSYVLQWWAFSGFTVYMLVRLIRDALAARGPQVPEPEKPAEEPVSYRRYVPPTAPHQELDATQVAYNDYLASLAEKKERR